jgi:hypothetical protein
VKRVSSELFYYSNDRSQWLKSENAWLLRKKPKTSTKPLSHIYFLTGKNTTIYRKEKYIKAFVFEYLFVCLQVPSFSHSLSISAGRLEEMPRKSELCVRFKESINQYRSRLTICQITSHPTPFSIRFHICCCQLLPAFEFKTFSFVFLLYTPLHLSGVFY